MRPRAEYGFARGEPVPIEQALGNRAQPTNPLRGSVPVAKRGFPRASKRQDACSERPARWHGPAPSRGGLAVHQTLPERLRKPTGA